VGSTGGMHRSTARDLAMVIAASAVFTSIVWATPSIRFAYPFPGVAIFVAALSSVTAGIVAVLFFFRHQRTRDVSDLVVVFVFGITMLLDALLPLIAEIEPSTSDIAFWSRLMGRTIVAITLCAAAWVPERKVRGRTSGLTMAAVCVAGVTAITTIAALRVSALPQAVSNDAVPGSAILHDPGVLGVRLGCTVLLLLAAFGFARRSELHHDDLLEWLAIAAVLLGEARFHDFLFPSLRSDWLTTGDLLRFVAQGVLVCGAGKEIRGVWERRVTNAATEERQRVAAELHDGLAQELAYLTTQSLLLADDPGNTLRLERIAASAERALSEARLAIAGFATTGFLRVDDIVRTVSREVDDRYGLPVKVDSSAADLVVAAPTAHEIARVVREALLNAARHAAATHVVVRVRASSDMVRVAVIDDGRGLGDNPQAPSSGYGLISMQQRVERLGGSCSIVSAPTRGTMVVFEVPRS
jgi:signal transduction histidine kinase